MSAEGDALDDANFAELIYELSDRAFVMAKDTAAGAGDAAERREGALELARRVNALAPRAQASIDRSLSAAVSEAIVDINYVLSEGRAPLSLRLNQVLR